MARSHTKIAPNEHPVLIHCIGSILAWEDNYISLDVWYQVE